MLAELMHAPMANMPDVDVGGELLRVVLSLGAIVALIFAAGWMMRRLQSRQIGGGRRLRCIESLPLGTRERVLLLEADGKRLLVGVGAGGLRTLHVYEGTVAQSETPALSPLSVPSFGDVLKRWGRSA